MVYLRHRHQDTISKQYVMPIGSENTDKAAKTKGTVHMFFKSIFYFLVVLIAMGLLGKTNYNTSLYKSNQNMLEFIFPIWNWGNPWFYAIISSDGVDFTKPDDLQLRYVQEKFDKAKQNKEQICNEKGLQSPECENADVELENMAADLEIAQEDLQDLIDEKGDEIKLSKHYEKDTFKF